MRHFLLPDRAGGLRCMHCRVSGPDRDSEFWSRPCRAGSATAEAPQVGPPVCRCGHREEWHAASSGSCLASKMALHPEDCACPKFVEWGESAMLSRLPAVLRRLAATSRQAAPSDGSATTAYSDALDLEAAARLLERLTRSRWGMS